jgi:hypothetical protein
MVDAASCHLSRGDIELNYIVLILEKVDKWDIRIPHLRKYTIEPTYGNGLHLIFKCLIINKTGKTMK